MTIAAAAKVIRVWRSGSLFAGRKDAMVKKEMRMDYQPKPERFEHIEMPEEVRNVLEAAARNIHEVWAENKLKEGWRYGEVLDYEKKTHPSLVPYEQLSERQKLYDRETAMYTIKYLLNAGFQITLT